MSIAVMNWVWANSPISGNECLVLLALADACSRDDVDQCSVSNLCGSIRFRKSCFTGLKATPSLGRGLYALPLS